EDGHQIVTAYDGEIALRRHAEERPDLVILDRKLPRVSGDDVVRGIRAVSNTPILMLTGEKGSEERARLLDLGADDYLEKPFSKRELSSRVRALLRRAPQPVAGGAMKVGRLTIDARTHRVAVNDEDLELTPTEFRLLAALASHSGDVVVERSIRRGERPEVLAGRGRPLPASVRRQIDVDIRRVGDRDVLEAEEVSIPDRTARRCDAKEHHALAVMQRVDVLQLPAM